MKQKVLKLMCLLCVGMISMSAWADTTYKLTITPSDFNTTSYAANNNEKTSTAVCTTDPSVEMDVKWTSNQVMLSSTVMQWQKNNGYIYNSTELGEIQSVTVDNSAGTFTTYYGKTAQPSSSITLDKDGFFQVKVGDATGKTAKIEVVFVIKDGKPATTTTINSTGITNTDLNAGTAAGTLTATVVDDRDKPVDASSIVWSSSDESVVTVGETTGVVTLVEEGTATITATYPSNSTYASSTATYDITVTNSYYTVVWSEDFTGYAAEYVPTSGTNATYAVSNGTGGGSTRVFAENTVGDVAPEILVAKTNGSFTVTITGLKHCLGSYKLSYKSNRNLTVEVLVNGLSVETSTDKTFTFNLPANPRTLVITFTNTTSNNARLDDIVLKGVADEVTYERDVTAGNYGTICLNSPASATGATFYTIAGKDAVTPSYITITEADADNLEAGVGYIFKATGSKIVATYKDFAVAEAEDAVNGLQGTLVAKADMTAAGVADGNLYMIKNNKVKAATLETSLAANRAYIDMSEVPVAAGVKGVRLGFDEATGITELTENTEKTEGTEGIYNLNGQRLNGMQKGINIVNGKKVLVK